MPTDNPDRLVVYAALIAIGVLAAASDAVLNQWAKTSQLFWLLTAYASWIVVATLLGIVLRWGYFSFGTAVVLFLLVNSIAALLLDYWLFSGRINFWGWVGVGLALAAILCIELGRAH